MTAARQRGSLVNLGQDVADAARSCRLARLAGLALRRGLDWALFDDLGGEATEPAVYGGIGIAPVGHVSRDGVGESVREGRRSGVAQRTGELAQSGNSCAKVCRKLHGCTKRRHDPFYATVVPGSALCTEAIRNAPLADTRKVGSALRKGVGLTRLAGG